MKKQKIHAISQYVGQGGHLYFEHGFDYHNKAKFRNGSIIGVGDKTIDYQVNGCVESINLNKLSNVEIEQVFNAILNYEQWLVESEYLVHLSNTIKNYIPNNTNQTF